MNLYIGLDIGGTKCAVVLASADAGIQILDKIAFPSRACEGPSAMLARVFGAMDEILQKNKLTPDKLEAVGISCGGPLDSRAGRVLAPPNLPGWDDVPICDLIRARFGVRAFLQNDANACALVEWKLGAGRGAKNMVFLTMGTGMGAGIIAEGRLLRGCRDLGGEVGHMRLAENGPVGYGKEASFEGFASGGGIARQAVEFTREAIARGSAPAWTRDGCAESDITAKRIAEYAFRGDADALFLYARAGKMLGRALAVLADVLNPEKIVIGSVFARAEALLRPAMEQELQKEALPGALEGLQIVKAETGEQIGDLAGVMAAMYALDRDPLRESEERNPRVVRHFHALFAKHPNLSYLKDDLMRAYLALRDCYLNGGKLLVCGNGGSCADAEHIVGELMKGFYLKRQEGALQGALPALSLTGHPALSTAFSNDVDASLVFAQQAAGYGRAGDVLLGISTSGNAQNVLAAARAAREKGLVTLALTGGTGGALARACDIAIIAPGSCPADVQECHLPIYHALCAMLEARFFEA